LGTDAVHTGRQLDRPQPAALNAYRVPIPLSIEPAEKMNTRPPATAGVVNAPLASVAVHSGLQLAAPQPSAGSASRKPSSVPT
jgi:hypothetical protein